MAIVARRNISQPDAHNFFNAFPLQAQTQTAVDILRGVTLVIGSVTLNAPAASEIYEAFRTNRGNPAAALRLYATHIGNSRVTVQDLNDFMYLLDDTIAGPGVPGMSPGQEWTISYLTVGGTPNQSLLTRLRDRRVSYGNTDHWQSIRGGEGAIRIVYDNTTSVSVETHQNQLAGLLRAFFLNATPASRSAARTSADYQQVFSNGYISFSNVRFREAELFFALIDLLEYTQLFTPASTAVSSLSQEIDTTTRRTNARTGAMEFMSTQRTLTTLNNNIRTPGLERAHALTADTATGFQEFDDAAKGRAWQSARRWRTRAHGVVRAASSTIDPPVPGHLTTNITTCIWVYQTALYTPAQLPRNQSSSYYAHLNSNPTDIWGAYTAMLAPVGRQTADRITYMILASWDPQSGELPGTLSQALVGTLRSLVGQE